MKKLYVIGILLFTVVCSYGQTTDMSKRFEEFKKQQNQRFDTFKVSQQAKFDAFRKEQNEKYAEFMKNSWEMFDALPPVVPEEEKKVEPVVYVEPKPTEPKKEEPKVEPKPAEPKKEEQKIDPKPAEPKKEEPKVEPKKEEKQIPVKKEVIVVPKPQPKPEPIAPVEPKEEIPHKIVSVSFYGTLVSVGFPTSDNLKIKALNENALSDAWMQLSNEKYDITLNNVLKVRDNMDLCDWGYIHMLQAITEKQYGKTNEAVLMQAFLLAQSNYKVRLAFGEGKLFVLVASQYSILGMGRYQLDGEYFYPLNCNIKKLNICKAAFDNEKSISLQLRKEQKLDNALTAPRKLSSKFGVVANVSVNKNDIDFFNTYPSAYINGNTMTRWVVYANTPLSTSIKKTLYPTLKKSITGLSERDAVNKILNFVQTAFTYEYDDKVWGHDRTFFAAETLHYPYADCEDRSILFARLVRDLLNLDVVLIYYPGHLATAVGFKETVNGDYLMYKNRRYTICDPTFINAPVGRTMTGMNNNEAQVIVL